MSSSRWLAALTVPVMIGAALVTNAAKATADPVNDAYLAQLRGVGITWPPGHDEALIGVAHFVCDDLGWVGHHSRSPTTSTPIWTLTASRWATSDPWSTSRTRPTAPTRGAGLRTAERSSSDADSRVASATMHAEQRDLDIVLDGATGPSASWSLGIWLAVGSASAWPVGHPDGWTTFDRRCRTRPCSWPLIVADEGEPEVLNRLAAQTRVMINTVGPYAAHGLPVVAACAAAGTDYIDSAAEVPFVRTQHRLLPPAGGRKRRPDRALLRIRFHPFGLDRVRVAPKGGRRRRRRTGRNRMRPPRRELRDGLLPGNHRHDVRPHARRVRDPQTRQLLDDPYSLSPDRPAEPDLGPQPDVSLCRGEELAPELTGLWTSGYLMALYNTRCVRRTNALLGWVYGRRFRYRETASMGSSPFAPALAAMTNATITGASRLGGAYLRMFPPGLLEARWHPTGRDGAPRGHYRVETERARRPVVRVRGRRWPSARRSRLRRHGGVARRERVRAGVRPGRVARPARGSDAGLGGG